MKRDRRYTTVDIWRCKEDGMELMTEPGFYRDPDRGPMERLCGCGCGTKFTPDPRHPNQTYVDGAHKQKAYRARRANR